MSRAFWSGAAERAVKTAAQTLLALLGAGALDVLHVPWTGGLSVAAGAAVLSLLTSIVSAPASPTGSPSLVQDRPGDRT